MSSQVNKPLSWDPNFPAERNIPPVEPENQAGLWPWRTGSQHPSCSVIRWHKMWLKPSRSLCPVPTVLSYTGSIHTRSTTGRIHDLHSQAPDTCFAVTLRPNMLPLTPASQWKCSFSPKFQCWSWKLLLECDEAADCLNTGVYNEGSREPSIPWRKWEVAFCLKSCCIILVHFVEPS